MILLMPRSRQEHFQTEYMREEPFSVDLTGESGLGATGAGAGWHLRFPLTPIPFEVLMHSRKFLDEGFHPKSACVGSRESLLERREALCLEEMEQDPEGRDPGQGEVGADAVRDRAAAEASGAVLQQVRGGIAFAPTAAREALIKWESRATIGHVPSAAWP